MTTLSDPDARELFEKPNYAVVSTHAPDGSIHSTIIWASLEDGNTVAINSAIGRGWPTQLQRDPRVTLLVYDAQSPYHFVEIRGIAEATTEGADEHINALSKKYTGREVYANRRPGEQRIKFAITPQRVRLVDQ
jgi:PPOX class probable F420-dependent enzyme